MVEGQLRRRGIHDERVLEAMATIPREKFVPDLIRASSYADEPLSIGHGQTISQPYITALMAELLELTGGEKVLEVGTGCGYHAVVLAMLAREVITVEIVGELAATARRNLAAAGICNVTVITGDGSVGYPPEAPYDAISVAAAAPAAPPSLVRQLADGGRLVIPVGSLDAQELRVISRSGGQLTTRAASACRFVPLRGGEGWALN